jgi:molybdopterin-guanine dinucleotide biosynthesis adapter protein
VHRPALGKPPIWPEQPDIVAIATDAPVGSDRAVLPLNDPATVAAWILGFAS